MSQNLPLGEGLGSGGPRSYLLCGNCPWFCSWPLLFDEAAIIRVVMPLLREVVLNLLCARALCCPHRHHGAVPKWAGTQVLMKIVPLSSASLPSPLDVHCPAPSQVAVSKAPPKHACSQNLMSHSKEQGSRLH